jgi:hypothetical protein
MNQNQVIIRTYKGSQAGAMAAYQTDAASLAAQGYFPISQSWAPGAYGCGSFWPSCFALSSLAFWFLFTCSSLSQTAHYP